MAVVEFRGDGDDLVRVVLVCRTHDASDYWDGNWISAGVEVIAGGFRGTIRGDLRAEELARFHGHLARLQESLSGAAEFETMERWLTIKVTGDGRGHMTVEGDLRDTFVGNSLRFSLSIDQTFLRGTLEELRAAIEAFPVIGER